MNLGVCPSVCVHRHRQTNTKQGAYFHFLLLHLYVLIGGKAMHLHLVLIISPLYVPQWLIAAGCGFNVDIIVPYGPLCVHLVELVIWFVFVTVMYSTYGTQTPLHSKSTGRTGVFTRKPDINWPSRMCISGPEYLHFYDGPIGLWIHACVTHDAFGTCKVVRFPCRVGICFWGYRFCSEGLLNVILSCEDQSCMCKVGLYDIFASFMMGRE